MNSTILYDRSINDLLTLTKELSSSDELQLILTPTALLRYSETISSEHQIIEMALRNTIPLCPRTIILTPPWEEWDAGGFTTIKNLGHHFKIPRLAIEIENLLFKIASNNSTASKVSVLPTSVVSHFEDWFDAEDWVTSTNNAFDFNDEYNNENGYKVSLNGNGLTHKLAGGIQEDFETCLVLYITYPEIQNVPADIVTRIIDDNYESYKRFQHVINKLLQSKKDLPSGVAVKFAISEVEYEVSRFSAELHAIKKSRAMSSYQALVGVGLIGLSLFISEELSKYLTAILGIHGTGSLIRGLIKEKDEFNRLKAKSDFYLPWVLSKDLTGKL